MSALNIEGINNTETDIILGLVIAENQLTYI